MADIRILVIDDDQDILDALRFVLEDAGYLVTTSETADAAEQLLDDVAQLPDLLILDVLLSGADGRTICKTLKHTAKTKDLPILMISAHPSAKKSVEKVGADDFLAKPFDIATLLSRIEAQVGKE